MIGVPWQMCHTTYFIQIVCIHVCNFSYAWNSTAIGLPCQHSLLFANTHLTARKYEQKQQQQNML